MVRLLVNSSNLRSVGWNPGTGILEVEFHSGSVYEYYDVPEEVYGELLEASSKGGYFHRNIRKTFSFKQVS